jgi:hypothetical protein
LRHSALLMVHPQEELTTSAHNALANLKHSASRPEMLDRGRSGGLAAVSQQSRSTTWSLTGRLKRSAAGRASTWYVRYNMSSKRLYAIFEAVCARCSGAHPFANSQWLQDLRLQNDACQTGKMERGACSWGGWTDETGILGAVLQSRVAAVSTKKTGLGRQFEVGRDDGANGWSWCCGLAPALASVRASRDAWGRRLSLQPVRVIAAVQDIDWTTTLQRFVCKERRAYRPCPRHAEHAPPVTHNGRRERLHDYNTLGSRSVDNACCTRSRCCTSGSQASPTSALVSGGPSLEHDVASSAAPSEPQFALSRCRSRPKCFQSSPLIGRNPSANPSAHAAKRCTRKRCRGEICSSP